MDVRVTWAGHILFQAPLYYSRLLRNFGIGSVGSVCSRCVYLTPRYDTNLFEKLLWCNFLSTGYVLTFIFVTKGAGKKITKGNLEGLSFVSAKKLPFIKSCDKEIM